MPIGFHWFEFVPLVLLWLIPVIIGFTYVRADANRRGQPGWLWVYCDPVRLAGDPGVCCHPRSDERPAALDQKATDLQFHINTI